MLKKAVVCAFGMLMMLMTPAFSTPIPSGTASDDVIFNFNFTGQTPPPPYSNMAIFITVIGTTNLAFVTDVYGSLDGANLIDTVNGTTGVTGEAGFAITCSSAAGALCSPLLDGIFSVGFHLTGTGSANVTQVSATERNAVDAAVSLNGAVAAAVPEPTSLALFGTAIVGFGALRRRRRAATRLAAHEV